MADTLNEIIEIIAKHSPVERADIAADSTLEDLEVESLDLVEIIFEIEEQFDISVPYNANEQADLRTVNDVVVAVDKLIGEKAAVG